MAVSAIFGSRIAVLPYSPSFPSSGGGATKAAPRVGGGGGALVIECSSRPQKKATAHHRKTRPRKSQPWDIRRGPTVYPALPPLPPDWTLVADDVAGAAAVSDDAAPPQPRPIIE